MSRNKNKQETILFTTTEVANVCEVCTRTIYNAMGSSKIFSIPAGSKKLIPATEFHRIKEFGWSYQKISAIQSNGKDWFPAQYLKLQPLFSIQEVADIFRISTKTIRKLIPLNILRTVRYGRKIYIHGQDLINLLVKGWTVMGINNAASHSITDDSSPIGKVLEIKIPCKSV